MSSKDLPEPAIQLLALLLNHAPGASEDPARGTVDCSCTLEL
ncbi:hypothetical protein ACFS7Z_23855 [Pontibacter toksunensis]|uniref:Uncharacterized protein n=1 Tax=Pontibacter toksunensis TaxID=1332631 RepID=A0ABW6C2F8_9BACT